MAQHVVMTVSGTGTTMWDQTHPQPAAVANALPGVATGNSGPFFWQPVGNYPAATFPMGPSVEDGVQELIRLVNDTYPPGNPIGQGIILLGYSQGAIVVSHFMRDHVVNPLGECHARWPDIVAVATWGNPCRTPGYASGNDFAGWPDPAEVDGVVTGGIAGPDDLEPSVYVPVSKTVTHYWGEFVNTIGNGTDIYADCPVGSNPWIAEAATGVVETNIYNIVQAPTGADIFQIILEVIAVIATVGVELIPIIEAIVNGGLFLQAGPGAAHYTYDIVPITNFIALAGSQTQPYVTSGNLA
jgi:PE-PPE domain